MGLARSPIRNLLTIIACVTVVMVLATAGYMFAGWSFGDAVYMVLLTVFTVGYGEVRPIDTPYLHAVTLGLMILGCTGMILVTGALVQVLTFSQIQEILGASRVKNEVGRLKRHTIICGFGRIGLMLARDLAAGGAEFVIVDRDEAKLGHARSLGYLAWAGEATDEEVLKSVGVDRARVLATVLPDDAANVFITLSARSLNSQLQIIARGEAPSTESKLLQAGANKVVMPTHIGAERIAEMILFPETARFIRGSERMVQFEKTLTDLGLDLEVVAVPETSQVVGETLRELEAQGGGSFFVVQINRQGGDVLTRPGPETRIEKGDGLMIMGRAAGRLSAMLERRRERPRAGRTVF